MNAGEYKFHPRWKEELVASIPGASFVIAAPMGILSVDFPNEQTWDRTAPDWAKGRWAEVKSELQRWCERDKIPLYVSEGAYIDFT